MATTNTQDTVGANYASVKCTVTPTPFQNASGTTANVGVVQGLVSSNGLSWYPQTGQTYQWSYGYGTDTEARTRIATLEGQVQALSAMVAALISGRASATPTPRKRTR